MNISFYAYHDRCWGALFSKMRAESFRQLFACVKMAILYDCIKMFIFNKVHVEELGFRPQYLDAELKVGTDFRNKVILHCVFNVFLYLTCLTCFLFNVFL